MKLSGDFFQRRPVTNNSILLKTSVKFLDVPLLIIALGNLLALKGTLCLPALNWGIILYISK